MGTKHVVRFVTQCMHSGTDTDTMVSVVWRSSNLSTTNPDIVSIAMVVVAAEVPTPPAPKRYELL